MIITVSVHVTNLLQCQACRIRTIRCRIVVVIDHTSAANSESCKSTYAGTKRAEGISTSLYAPSQSLQRHQHACNDNDVDGDSSAAVPTTLILREMQQPQLKQLEQNPLEFLEACDVAAFVYNSSSSGGESFQEAKELLLKVAQSAEDSIPCVLVGAKEESGVSSVKHLDPAVYVHAYVRVCVHVWHAKHMTLCVAVQPLLLCENLTAL